MSIQLLLLSSQSLLSSSPSTFEHTNVLYFKEITGNNPDKSNKHIFKIYLPQELLTHILLYLNLLEKCKFKLISKSNDVYNYPKHLLDLSYSTNKEDNTMLQSIINTYRTNIYEYFMFKSEFNHICELTTICKILKKYNHSKHPKVMAFRHAIYNSYLKVKQRCFGALDYYNSKKDVSYISQEFIKLMTEVKFIIYKLESGLFSESI